MLIFPYIVFANESRVILGSSVKIIDSENTNIIMQEEEIIITLYREYYEVKVAFVFYNSGSAETVLLGFPVRTVAWDSPDRIEMAQLLDFQTYFDGNLITEYTVIEEASYYRRHITTLRWFVREVTFPENSHTISKVIFRAPYSQSGHVFTYAGYIFGTGRYWKDNIGEMTIIINHGDDIRIDRVNIGNNREYEFKWKANGKYKFFLENVEPEINENIFIFVTPIDIYSPGDPFGTWAEGWIWDRYLLYDDSRTRRLFTMDQLSLFINFFYAFHGYYFQNPRYRNYFQDIIFSHPSHRRYVVNPNFSVNDFNEIERRNIAFLRGLKNKIPSTEQELNILAAYNEQSSFRVWKYFVVLGAILAIVFIILKGKKLS